MLFLRIHNLSRYNMVDIKKTNKNNMDLEIDNGKKTNNLMRILCDIHIWMH